MKRLIDIVCSAIGLLVLGPVLVVAGIGVILTMGRPVLFSQSRPGLHGHPFVLVKFRTMRDAVDGHGRPLSDAARLTRFGKFLRATSIDELPQLFNVLRGQMSLVGPRPLLTEYLTRYSAEQARRHEVRPGLTGWSQVNGRNSLDWPEKLALDVWYVDNRTLWLDIRILAMTVAHVLGRKDISAHGHVTMPHFMGSDADG